MTTIRYAMGNDAPSYDVVIIGAGAAGITIARKLSAQGVRVALVEGGQYDLTDVSQRLYQADIVGHPYTLTGTRLRQFGGATNHWGGYVCALDADTFQARDDLSAPYNGWPIDKAELDPYFYEGIDILDIPQNAPWKPAINHYDPFDNAMRANEFQELYWNQSPPTRFREKYFEEVSANPNIDVLLDQSLVNWTVDADGTMQSVEVVTLEGQEPTTLTAKQFVLATGAIENARLLLFINERNGTNYGNASGMVGKYFMEHPELDAAQFVMMDPNYQHRVNNHALRFFRPTREWQLRENLPGAILRMYFTHQSESDEIISELESLTTLRRYDGWRAGYIMMSFEQMAVPENRIALDYNNLDTLGMPYTTLHWHLQAQDYHAPRVLVKRFAELMLQHNFGRVRLFDWILDNRSQPDPLWAKHHLGTTRMGRNENEGVVDTDAKLFGTKNMYLMGSSIYPVGGYENPTLPILMLSMRLSDHLLRLLSE